MFASWTRRFAFSAVFLGILAASAVPAVAGGQDRRRSHGEKYALLVGVRRYDKNELRSLPFSEPDVVDLAKTLKDSGYKSENVVLMTQTTGAEDTRFLPNAENIRKELQLLLQDRSDDDCVIVALAGHGVQFRGTDDSFFCPVGTKLSDKKTLVNINEIYKEMEKCQAGMKLLLVDACRNDPQSDNSRARAEVELESVTRPQKKEPPGGVVAFFSCSAGEKAFEHEDLKHGVFFNFIIEGLKGAAIKDDEQEVTLPDLERYVKRAVSNFVRDKYGVRQMPELNGRSRGLVALATIQDIASGIIKRADAFADRKELDRAIEEYTAAIKASPKNANGYHGRAWCYAEKRQHSRAISDYTDAIRHNAKNADSFNNRAYSYRMMGKFQDAIDDCDKALELNSNHFLAYFNRGESYRMINNYDRSIADMNEAIRINPKPGYTYGTRAASYWKKNRLDKALEDIEHAISVDSKNAWNYNIRGLIYESKRDTAEAVNSYQKAIDYDPKFKEAYSNRAFVYGNAGEYDWAIADYTKVIDLDSRDANAWQSRGWCKFRQKLYEDAIADLNEAISLNPRLAIAYHNRGAAYSWLNGQQQQALRDYTKSIQLQPTASAYRDRARLLESMGDNSGAERDRQRAQQLDPNIDR